MKQRILLSTVGTMVMAGAFSIGVPIASASQPVPGLNTCSPDSTAFTADGAWAQALSNGAPVDQETWVKTIFWPSVDLNGDGILCETNGSVGRAQGHPAWYANWVDNNDFGQLHN